MEDGPTLTDHTVTNGTDNGNEKSLWKCTCGWQKVTSLRGLRIHQERMKCGKMPKQHNRTALAGQTEGTQSLVANHRLDSAERATSADEGEEEASRESEMRTVPSQVTQPGSQRKHLERCIKVKWPKANMQEVWCRLDEHLSGVLQHSLRGTVEHKLTLMGNIIYEECRERFGECISKQTIAPRQRGQRERHIELLISDRRHLKKRWRKAAPEKKEGLSCYGMTLSRGWPNYAGQNGSGGGGNGRRRKGRISSKTLSSMPANCWKRSGVVSWPSLKRIWNII